MMTARPLESREAYSCEVMSAALEALRSTRLPEELCCAVVGLANPRIPAEVREELLWCWAAAAVMARRVDENRDDDFGALPPDVPPDARRGGVSAVAASVAAALLVRRGGRDVALRGRGLRRSFYFPRQRRGATRAPVYDDTDDEDDIRSPRACAFVRHAAVFLSIFLLLAPSVLIAQEPALNRYRAKNRRGQ